MFRKLKILAIKWDGINNVVNFLRIEYLFNILMKGQNENAYSAEYRNAIIYIGIM